MAEELKINFAFACRDDCLERMVPSDLRALVRERDALSAQLPSQGGEAVAWQYQSRDGEWCNFTDEKHRVATAEDGTWPMRALYAHPADQGAVAVRRELLERAVSPSAIVRNWALTELRALLADK